MAIISDANLYQIELFWGVLNVVFGLLGLFFVYRWGVTLMSTDDDVRRVLMGEPFFTWFGGNEDVILIFAAGYLGFKLLYIVITTARWELDMEKTRRRLYGVRHEAAEKKQKQVERQEYISGVNDDGFTS